MRHRPLRLRIIFFQALVATMSSLYLGRYGDPVMNYRTWQWFNPDNGFGICDLCRYARILMYPLVLISGVALIRNDNKAVFYMLPSVILGIMLETLHYTAQMFTIDIWFTCTAANPCMAFYVRYFGFLTIPGLCLIAFLVILWAILYGLKYHKHETLSLN